MTKTSVIKLLSITLFALASCNRQEAMLSESEARLRDSLALHVAVLPIEDCLPLYVAEARGLADSVGLDLRLVRYDALMDVDTAYLRRHVEVAWEDSFRLAEYHTRHPHFVPGNDSVEADTLWGPTPGRLFFIASRKSKVKKLKDLGERMVAVTRWSLIDSLCTMAVDAGEVNQQDVYRPQINNVKLRARMLRENLIDCAILPEPYASWVKAEKHRVLYKYPESLPKNDSTGLRRSRITGFHVRKSILKDSLRQVQLKQLVDIYIKGQKILVEEGLSTLDSLDVFTL